jgi:hypothetical protein
MGKITDLMDIHLGIAGPKEEYVQYSFLDADPGKTEPMNFKMRTDIYVKTTKPRIKPVPDRWEQYKRKETKKPKFTSYYQLVKAEREKPLERVETVKIDWIKQRYKAPQDPPNQITGSKFAWIGRKKLAAY